MVIILTNGVVEFIAQDLSSLNVINGAGFLCHMELVEPCYTALCIHYDGIIDMYIVHVYVQVKRFVHELISTLYVH